MDTVNGVYYPSQGGMHAIPQALADAAEKSGASFRYGVRASRVETDTSGVTAVRLETGERLPASHVIVACDLPRARTGLVPEAGDWRLRAPRYSPSCLLMHFGLTRPLPAQAHHTLHFGRRWKEGFDALAAGRAQPDPSLLITHPGDGTLTVLEPAPNLATGADWDDLTPHLTDRLRRHLADLGYDLPPPRVVVDPPAWARLGHSAGTPFALDHRFRQTAWFRPSGRGRVPRLHFAGMYTAPGVGVPPALISGRLAADRILEDAPCR
jgi:phytoene desaturase